MHVHIKNKTDIRESAFIFRILPRFLKPYARLARWDRPAGVALLCLPCLWGVTLADLDTFHWREVLLFILGSFLMRGAGCTYNDMVDRKIDRQVERTSTRPLARGDLKLFQATVFLVLQLLLSVIVLYQLTPGSIALGYVVIFLVLLYPWAKRFTYWPQLILGMTFNWGVLIAWASVNDRLKLSTFLMYFAGIAWTLSYDTIYAHQDKESDAMIGVKSTALRFGTKTKPYLAFFYFCFVFLTGMAGYIENLKSGFYATLVLVVFFSIWIFKEVDLDDPQDCLKKFKLNAYLGLLVYLGLLFGR